MNTDEMKQTKQPKVTVVGDIELLDNIERHRESLRNITGVNISLSAAAASLIRAGLQATRAASSH